MPSTARGTLDAAHFFVAKAAEVQRADTNALRHYLEAAIVFARSVTFHIQSEFRGREGFDSWYSVWQERLRQDPVAQFVLDKRNLVLKVGRVGLTHEVSLHMGDIIFASEFAVLRVVRGTPWYRRSLRILWQDAIRPWRERLARHRAKRARKRRQQTRKEQRQASAAVSDYRVRFVDAPIADCSATELLTRNLHMLEELVADAEARFEPTES